MSLFRNDAFDIPPVLSCEFRTGLLQRFTHLLCMLLINTEDNGFAQRIGLLHVCSEMLRNHPGTGFQCCRGFLYNRVVRECIIFFITRKNITIILSLYFFGLFCLFLFLLWTHQHTAYAIGSEKAIIDAHA